MFWRQISLFPAAVLVLVGAGQVWAEPGPGPAVAVAINRRKPRPPLIDGNERQRGLRQTHCHFGNQTYELEERWRPNLGPPFGVLYCVRCECVALQRKKRIVARARCENIKNGCPKPGCENPVLLPERCCKVCPGEDGAGLEEDLSIRMLESDDEDKNVKEFSVLMTGRGVPAGISETFGAARAYLTFNKRSLHYTVHSAELERPTVIRFMDEEENILEEHEVPSPHHHVNSSKVCGVWRKVPKVYRRLLLKEKLVLALANEKQPEGLVAGKILKSMRISKEVFSALLVPENKSKHAMGTGGVAIISTERNYIYLVLDFIGIFQSSDSRNVPVHVQVLRENNLENKLTVVTSAMASLPKVHPEFNSVNVRVNLSQEDQQQMATGQLRLRIYAREQGVLLQGPITPKVTCNVFQATLAGGPEVAVGQVFLQPSDGTLAFQMQVWKGSDTDQPLMAGLAVEDSTKNELRTLATSTDTQVLDKMVWGSFPSTVEQVEMLLADDLFLTLTIGQHTTRHWLAGRIRQRLYTDAFVNEVPLMLTGQTPVNSSSVGQAWLTVDKNCDLHYALYTSGLTNGGTEDKEEKERHILELQETPRYGPPQQRLLHRLDPDEIEGVQEDMTLTTLARLKAGQAHLLVSSKAPGRTKALELKTRVLYVPVPITCLPGQDTSHVDEPSFVDDESIPGPDPNHRCYYEEEMYQDGTQWKAKHDPCTMCSCQHGRVVCDKILCAAAPCPNPVTLPEQCCAVCLGEGATNTTALSVKSQRWCYFEGDKTYHLAGSSWHPYIPPFGFSRCALCTCQADSLVVECKRITCPPLPCPEKDAVRENPQACCKQCTNTQTNMVGAKPAVVPTDQAGDEGSQKTVKDILAAGGCEFQGQVFANGDSWHPTVQPYGEMKCVNCHCKDGRPRCKRQKCPKLTCPVKLSSDKECCPKCAENMSRRKANSVGGSYDRRLDKTRKAKDRRSQEEKTN